MTEPPGSKKTSPLRDPTLANGKKHSWEKGKYTFLALYWSDALKHAGSGQAVVTLKTDAQSIETHHSVPRVGIRIEKHAGSLENKTGETIRYVLT